MKKTAPLCLIFPVLTDSSANVITLSGNYQGKNLYVQNPFAADNVHFCVYEVRVNGNVTSDETAASAFEIDLAVYRFQTGDAVDVEIFHRDGCLPKILNAEALAPKACFKTTSISVDDAQKTLTWETTDESGSLPYLVQEFRWNKWITTGQVQGVGTPGAHTYSCPISPASGANKFRVSQKDQSGVPRVSPPTGFVSTKPAVTFVYDKAQKSILFSEETRWEVYDMYGNIRKTGMSQSFSMKELPAGGYLLNYDNSSATFAAK